MVERNENMMIISSIPVGIEEEKVVNQNLWCRIRTLSEQGLNKTGIARELGIDLKTVRKWLRQNWEPQKRDCKSALDAHAPFLRARAPEVGYNAAVLSASWSLTVIRDHTRRSSNTSAPGVTTRSNSIRRRRALKPSRAARRKSMGIDQSLVREQSPDGTSLRYGFGL
ncbi:MAG: hypothetical protein KIT57_11850 [Blastocatellales bacterium]|nr:hypothetical protein [Blastocatellales bacterium]